MPNSRPITIQAIDHVVLRVNDLEKMIGFYRDVLGCTLERGPGETGLAQMRAGTSLIDLVDVQGPIGRKAGGPPDRSAPNMDHFCIQVAPWDAAAIQSHLSSHSVEYGDVEQRYGALGQGPSIYLQDPESNWVELKGPPSS